MEEIKHVPDPRNRHETTDVNVWAVGKFAIGLVAITVISVVLLFGLMRYFQSQDETRVAITVEPTKVFPQPQLQKSPLVDLRDMRSEEDKLLNSYAWLDEKKGVVRIPVDLAIDVLAKRGIHSRPPTAATPSESVPTESTHLPEEVKK